jgi:hypothetical protein
MLFLQIFGGYERWIYPQYFNTFIILPDELLNYKYSNPYTGLSYTLDWNSADAYSKLVRTIAQDKMVLPCTVKPTYKLTNISDGSTRYGGPDSLADWRLAATIRYEIEIPSFLVLQSDYLAEEIVATITAESTYSAYDHSVPTFQLQYKQTVDWGLDETSNSIITPPWDATSELTYEGEYEFKTRMFHIVTQEEVDSTSNLTIDLSFEIDDINTIRVFSIYGEMDYGVHYYYSDDKTQLIIRRDNVELTRGMIIELYHYLRTD